MLVATGVSLAEADTIELPERRPGYWEIRIAHEAPAPVPEMTVHACIDKTTDRAMMEAGTSAMKNMCSRQETKRDGETYVWESECAMGPMKTTSHAVLSGDYQAAYTLRIASEIVGLPLDGGKDASTPKKTVMTQTAKWLGETCPTGVKAGDMQMPGGMTINVGNVMKSLGGTP